MKKILSEIISSFKTHDLKSDAMVFSIQIGAILLNLLTNLLLARIMNPQDFGAFAYSTTLIFVLAGIGTFGTQNLLVREAGTASAQNKISLTKYLLRWSLKRSVIFTLLLTGFFICISFQFNLFFRSEHLTGYTMPMLISLGAVPLLVIILVNQSFLQGLRKIFNALFAEKIVKPFLVVAIAGTVFLLLNKQQLSFSNSALINVIAFFIALIIIAIAVNRSTRGVTIESPGKEITDLWKKSSITFFLFNIVTLIYLRTDILALGFFETTDKIGVYNISARVADIISFPMHILTFGLSPLIAQLYSSGQKIKLQKIISTSTRIIFILSFIPAVIFIFFGTEILGLFGKHFEEGHLTLIILVVANMSNVIVGPAGYVLVMTGHERFAFISMSVACAVNIAANLLFIPAFGISGAAMAVCCAMVVWNILIAVYTFKKTGIRPDIVYFFKTKEV